MLRTLAAIVLLTTCRTAATSAAEPGSAAAAHGGQQIPGCEPSNAPPETAVECRDCVPLLVQTMASALCTCHPPEDGAPCCEGEPSWCDASSAACTFDRCAAGDDVIEA